MVTPSRWSAAQTYERSYWASVADEVARGADQRVGFYEWRAGELLRRIREAGFEDRLTGEYGAVEIGSGPVGVVGYLPATRKVAVDPLAEFYASHEALAPLRPEGVLYVRAGGEAVPVPDRSADLVIIENCIDHVQDPGLVMDEIARITRPGGILYFTVNARSRPGFWVHRLLARLSLDPGHPHTFTQSRAARFVASAGFRVHAVESGSLAEAWWEDLRSGGKATAKGILGVSEFLVTIVAERKESDQAKGAS